MPRKIHLRLFAAFAAPGDEPSNPIRAVKGLSILNLNFLPEAMMERETGFEPATNSLEGCDSTPELLPHWNRSRQRRQHGLYRRWWRRVDS